MPRSFECRECGGEFYARGTVRRTPEFCGSGCKSEWHNRRRARGAMLYDLVMASRYERHRNGGGRPPLVVIAQLAAQFHELDQLERSGRRSWDFDAVVDRIDRGVV